MAAHIFSKRKVAYILTLVCYREVNCWEHYHTQQKVLNMSIYKEMLSAVKEKLAFYLPFVKYMRMSSEEWLVQGEKLSQKDQELMLGFVFYSRSIDEWEPAKRVHAPKSDNFAEYLLWGRFKEACANSEKLDNALMREINMDVHSRMFTLIDTNRIST